METRFVRWLKSYLKAWSMSPFELSQAIHCDPKTVRMHLKGRKPKFTQVVTYIWFFAAYENPYDIWQEVEEDYE